MIMSNKKPRPGSQLFLFADKFNKNLEDIFSGSVIFEYDLLSHTNIGLTSFSKKEKELQLLNALVAHFDRQYKKARVITNYKDDALLMYQLGASNSHAYKLKNQKDYKDLSSLANAFENYKNLIKLNGIFNHQKQSFKSFIKPLSRKELATLRQKNSKIELEFNNYLKHLDDQLNDSFSCFKAVK